MATEARRRRSLDEERGEEESGEEESGEEERGEEQSGEEECGEEESGEEECREESGEEECREEQSREEESGEEESGEEKRGEEESGEEESGEEESGRSRRLVARGAWPCRLPLATLTPLSAPQSHGSSQAFPLKTAGRKDCHNHLDLLRNISERFPWALEGSAFAREHAGLPAVGAVLQGATDMYTSERKNTVFSCLSDGDRKSGMMD
ncbi:hypothetical protein llap_16959 [Limosa lapponica baueri]|uniref:Uncharacterized protein n=1 Tax=Limosa lapponica baueri TaxID=1758121 RepID=A0A2I0TFZ6_LIMLA|nr:hypothetical protein llap_16959 [Limosa lapponica baueri]